MDISCILCNVSSTRQSTSSTRSFSLELLTLADITSLFTDLSLSRVPENILFLYQMVLCLLRAIDERRTIAKWAIIQKRNNESRTLTDDNKA